MKCVACASSGFDPAKMYHILFKFDDKNYRENEIFLFQTFFFVVAYFTIGAPSINPSNFIVSEQ